MSAKPEAVFGYLVADPSCLSEKEFTRYHACYCGLCRRLGERYGALSRLTLTYDMTFLVMLLNSLYEPGETAGRNVCVRHPREAHPWWYSSATDYAVDMNLALAYYKCMDDWEDDSSLSARAEAGALHRALQQIEAANPRQCAAIKKGIADLHQVEKLGGFRPDEASACFGSLMGEILLWKEDHWAPALRVLGDSLGRFIYLLDAAMDLDCDTIKDSYNPFRRFYGCADNEQRFRSILRMTLSEGVAAFDYLPLVQDADIMKSILCSGLWSDFNKKYARDPSNDDKGSV